MRGFVRGANVGLQTFKYNSVIIRVEFVCASQLKNVMPCLSRTLPDGFENFHAESGSGQYGDRKSVAARQAGYAKTN